VWIETIFSINPLKKEVIMATSQNPLTGKMSGAVGNFVTSTLGSKNIVRSKAFARINGAS
jgi:hypothetical protein